MRLAYFLALPFKSAAWRAALMCLIMALTSPAGYGRSVLDLDDTKQPIALGDWGEYWLDNTSAAMTPDLVYANASLGWLPTPELGIYPLGPRQTLWIRFTIPPAPDAERWVLEIPYPALDRASLYTRDRLGQFSEQRAGDLTAVNRWDTPHRHPLLTVAFNAEEPTYYLLRLENAQGFGAPLQFVNTRYLLRSEQQNSLFMGFYFGIALLGCLIGLIGFVWERDRAYLYYGACSALLGLTLAAITGAAALHLWPDSPQWADRSLSVLGTWTLLTLMVLNANAVSLAQRSRLLNALVWAVAGLGVVLSVQLGVTDSAWRLRMFMPYVVLVPLVVLGINVWTWRRGDRYSGWLLLTVIPFAVSWAIAIVRYFDHLPLGRVTGQSSLAGLAVLLSALLAVLVLRSQQNRENRRRLVGVDRIDPETGLITEQVFSQRLLRMNARAERFKHHSAVVLIDIINTEQTQRDFGRKIADEMPLRVASRLLSTVRDIDSAARLSERRFGMLVEGPISAEAAATLGPRIIARCLMPFNGLHPECVAQVRIAYALVPYQGSNAPSLLARLDERLSAAASAGDKRAVFMLAESYATQLAKGVST
jgi:two-component system, sensor histidine kinase LadS